MSTEDEVPEERTQDGARPGWVNRRRNKIAAEIARNRRGEYKVPTWVLVVVLVVFLTAWVLLIAIA
ncbi:MAG TPA: hypothetical protein VFC00_20325 [Micromonosporaceae bacterium]|nr:hypothetical protein [Micromonosporaceae bacterium]